MAKGQVEDGSDDYYITTSSKLTSTKVLGSALITY